MGKALADGYRHRAFLMTKIDGGAWSTRYDAERGFADALITPSTDTVRVGLDGRGRVLTPSSTARASSSTGPSAGRRPVSSTA